MDSITQFALGSAIGVAVMGRKTPLWKSALIGGLTATLPDLDAFIDHGDPIRNMTYHRGESHAIFYLTLATPFIAWAITRLPAQRPYFRPWLLATWLILVTHTVLDLMTVYGTQIGLPFFKGAYGVSSIFIIDPLYTFPLIIGLIAAGLTKSSMRYHANHIGLLISTLYLVWSMGAQSHVRAIAAESLEAENIQSQEILVTPTAFNTVLWRVLAMTDKGYVEGFYSLFDDKPIVVFSPYTSDHGLYEEWRDDWYVQRMEWFTQGFFKMDRKDGKVILSDLRMGQEPFYSFNFVLDRDAPPEHYRSRPEIKRVLKWVRQRMGGNPESLESFLKENPA